MIILLYSITSWIITTQFLSALFVLCIIHHYIKPRYKRIDTSPIKTQIQEPEKITIVKQTVLGNVPIKPTNSRPTSSTPLYTAENDHLEDIATHQEQEEDDDDDGKILENPFELHSEPTYKLVPDLNYYYQQYGLSVDTYRLTTEDGFMIDLWHIVNPSVTKKPDTRPILFLHGLLQSSGSFASSGTKSLAYYLTVHGGKDCWLGNNRCGFVPGWTGPKQNEPKKSKDEKWGWDIEHMAKYDLPCLVDFVLKETESDDLDLIAHSQGTMQTFFSLTNSQELLGKIKNFVSLSPAIYPGALLFEKIPVRIMAYLIDNKWVFGKTVFIPLMMQMRKILGKNKTYCKLSYLMFNYLFDWSDILWDIHLRNRHFLFSPVYISVRLMQWWLSSEGPSFRNGKFSEKYFPEHKIWYPTTYHENEIDGIVPSRHNRNTDDNDGANKENLSNYHMHTMKDKNDYPNFLIFAPKLDRLVDGVRVINHFTKYEDPELYKIWYIEHYSHLDVLWATDVLEHIGKPILENL